MCISACCICVCVCAYSIDSPLHQCINHFVHRFFPRSFAHYVFFLFQKSVWYCHFYMALLKFVASVSLYVFVCARACVSMCGHSSVRFTTGRWDSWSYGLRSEPGRPTPPQSCNWGNRWGVERSFSHSVIHSFFNFYFFMKTTHFGDRFP